MLNGYVIRYRPKHPRAITSRNYKGYVYEHTLVAEKNIGRFLRPNEEVHHLDQNKRHNSPENLIVLLASEHTRLHNFLRKLNLEGTIHTKRCVVCKFPIKNTKRIYCSKKCQEKDGNQRIRKVKERPSLESILADVSNLGWSGTGRKYGVSDNAIRKWVKTETGV